MIIFLLSKLSNVDDPMMRGNAAIIEALLELAFILGLLWGWLMTI